MADPITTIGLCAGVGWLDEAVGAGLRHFGLQHRVAAYCEWEAYAQAVLLARMEESSLEPAPVWGGDLGEFDGRPFRGAVDGIAAGFPCQPWSNAGKRQGTEDARWLWPVIVRVIADVGPWFVFLENVSALITGGGLEHVLSDLAEMGFDAEWCCLTAEAAGASHRRDRVFILAYRAGVGERESRRTRSRQRVQQQGRSIGTGGRSTQLGNACGTAGERKSRGVSGEKAEGCGSRCSDGGCADGSESAVAAMAVAGSDGGRVSQLRRRSSRRGVTGGSGAESGIRPCVFCGYEFDHELLGKYGCPNCYGEGVGDTESEPAQGGRREHAGQRLLGPSGGSLFSPGPGADWSGIPEALWPATERGFRVLVDGSALVLDASRADQLRCGGNGVVALQGAVAFVELVRRAGLKM